MADEMSIGLTFSVVNGNFQIQRVENITPDQATAGGGTPGTVNVGTSEEDVTFADVGVGGWVILKNLDATNYVTWGPKSGGSMVPMGRLLPGEYGVFRLDDAATIIRMEANTAACLVEVLVMSA